MHINTISYILQETTFKQSLCLGCLDTDKVERGNRKKKAFLSVTNFALNSPSLYAAIAEKRSKKIKIKIKKIKAVIIPCFSIHIIPYKKKSPKHYFFFSKTTGTYVYCLLIYSLFSELIP